VVTRTQRRPRSDEHSLLWQRVNRCGLCGSNPAGPCGRGADVWERAGTPTAERSTSCYDGWRGQGRPSASKATLLPICRDLGEHWPLAGLNCAAPVPVELPNRPGRRLLPCPFDIHDRFLTGNNRGRMGGFTTSGKTRTAVSWKLREPQSAGGAMLQLRGTTDSLPRRLHLAAKFFHRSAAPTARPNVGVSGHGEFGAEGGAGPSRNSLPPPSGDHCEANRLG